MDRDDRFYADVPVVQHFHEVPSPTSYRPAPDTWAVVITDVKGSTAAVEAGRYKDVNVLGVGSIVAVRNALPDVDIPYVFGGDGATLLCPASRLPAVRAALRGLQQRAQGGFGLHLRAGVVPLPDLRAAGHDLLVTRFAASAGVTFAMLAGSGVGAAERWLRDPELGPRYAVEPGGEARADLAGFECRWQPLESQHGEVVSLVVHTLEEDREDAARTYRRIIADIEDILGEGAGCPASTANLQLAGRASAFDAEARLKTGRARGGAFALKREAARWTTAVGRVLMATGWSAGGFDGARYRQEVVDNTDYRKFDDTLRMVIDVRPEQREALGAALERAREAGEIVYGMHVDSAALMTCIVGSYEGNHVHFVDGAEGGYTLAARQLKQQLRERNGG